MQSYVSPQERDRGCFDTDTQKKRQSEDGGEDWSDAATS